MAFDIAQQASPAPVSPCYDQRAVPFTSPLALLAASLALAFVASVAGCAEESNGAPVDTIPGGSGTGQLTTGGAGDGGSGDGAGGGALPCEEWSGPFGTNEQETLDPTLSWGGFEPGAVEPTTVGLEDYALCGDGEDVTAIVVYIDALWCSVCRGVAEGLADKYDSDWKDRGIRVVTLVVENEDAQPADVESAWLWRNEYRLEDTAVAYDAAYSLANDVPRTLPQALVVDPRSMRVVARHIGKVDLEPTLDALIDGRTE